MDNLFFPANDTVFFRPGKRYYTLFNILVRTVFVVYPNTQGGVSVRSSLNFALG